MGRRSGTENVPGIIGTAIALMLADGLMSSNAEKARHLRDRIIDELSSMDGVFGNWPGARTSAAARACLFHH